MVILVIIVASHKKVVLIPTIILVAVMGSLMLMTHTCRDKTKT